ncbi:MAG: YgeY family selenium metabolism-linked hydrolase [Anaerolineae bacterium]|nr:YgeY family selenium metabolism-linked hydrolase [Anaerolineae bacterium]
MNQWTLTSSEQDSLLAFLRDLVRTPSLPGQEEAVATRVLEEMHRLGYDEVGRDEAGNVWGEIGSIEGPVLMLNSHLDTVEVAEPDAWTADPWGAEVRNGRLYGVGASDMKAGLAATVYGAALLAKQQATQKTPLAGRVLVACVGLEESAEGTCTRVLLKTRRLPNWVVIAEPSNLQVVRAQRGHLEMRLTVKGRSAHSSTPELGENAIYAASRVIFGLEILAEQLNVDPFLGPGVLAVTDIQSCAVSRNAVPDRCDLIIDRRLTLGETESLALAEVQRVIAREGINAEVHVIEEEITTYTGKVYPVRKCSPPWALDEHHPLVVAMVQAARDVGLRPTITKWHFATEGAYTAGVAQIPTIGFGPGYPELAHTCNEYVELAQVYAAASVYAALGARLLKANSPNPAKKTE